MLQVEVAGTVIQFEDDEAALVVYCHETANGKHVILKDEASARVHEPGYLGSDEHYNYVLDCVTFTPIEEPVIARSVGENIVYAAIFPRIRLFTERGKQKGLIRRTPQLWAVTYEGDRIEDDRSERVAYPILYAGNVTEVDWTNVIWDREIWNRQQEQKEWKRKQEEREREWQRIKEERGWKNQQ